MERGRPRSEIPRQKQLNLRLSDFEYEKILRVAKKKNLTRTAAILRGIDLLERDKPKKFKNLSGNNKKISKFFYSALSEIFFAEIFQNLLSI